MVFQCLSKFSMGDNHSTILFDTGVSSNGIVENAKRMGIDLSEVLHRTFSWPLRSFWRIRTAIKAINKIDLPIIAHKNMIKRRGTANSKGEIREYPAFPAEEHLTPAKIVNTKKPHLIANKIACITGEIPRKISFEKGLPQNRILFNNTWQSDSIFWMNEP